MGSTSSIVISFSIAILLLLILLLLLSYNSKCKVDRVERFVDDNPMKSYESFANEIGQSFPEAPHRASVASNDPYVTKSAEMSANMGNIAPYEAETTLCDATGNSGVEKFTSLNEVSQDPTTCFKRDRLTKDDLLPKDANLKWAQVNPSSVGDITDKNFLTAGYHLGINTVGQSLRNANLQLRSEIPNPQIAVSPWLISTIEPDIRPVSFEIGSAPSY
jgi:hypothetical protein